MSLSTLGASILGNVLADDGTIRTGQDFWSFPLFYLILNRKGIVKMN